MSIVGREKVFIAGYNAMSDGTDAPAGMEQLKQMKSALVRHVGDTQGSRTGTRGLRNELVEDIGENRRMIVQTEMASRERLARVATMQAASETGCAASHRKGPDPDIVEQRTASQKVADRRRESELWAAEYLQTPKGAMEWSQPSSVNITDRIPFACRPMVNAAFIECIEDLQHATDLRTAADTHANRQRQIGAWVVVLRLFLQSATKQDRKRKAQNVRRWANKMGLGEVKRALLHHPHRHPLPADDHGGAV
jgi:hypothetical protein